MSSARDNESEDTNTTATVAITLRFLGLTRKSSAAARKTKSVPCPKARAKRRLAVGCSAWLDQWWDLSPSLPIHDPIAPLLVHARYFFARILLELRYLLCVLLFYACAFLVPGRAGDQVCDDIVDIFYPSHKA